MTRRIGNDDIGGGTTEDRRVDRRSFMGTALGAAAGLGAAAFAAGDTRAAEPNGTSLSVLQQAQSVNNNRPTAPRPPELFRDELDIRDCQVEGKIPKDLNGAFYRTGPDAQYPIAKGNIPFDGEGHVSMFRIKDGRVHFRSRFVR